MTAIRRPSRRTRFAGIALVAPLALGLAACGDSDDDADDAPAAVVTVTATPTPTTDDGADDGADDTPSAAASGGATTSGRDLQTAAITALGAVDGTVFSVDRDVSGGWEVSIVGPDGTDNEVSVAADATTITRGPVVDNDDDGDDKADRERLLDVPVDYLAAVEAAVAAVPGTATSVDLGEDNGTATWEVQLGEDTAADETTVDVDATTGEVLRTERDD